MRDRQPQTEGFFSKRVTCYQCFDRTTGVVLGVDFCGDAWFLGFSAGLLFSFELREELRECKEHCW